MELFTSEIIYEVAISTFFLRSRSRLRPNFGRMALRPKFNLCLSSTPTAAAAAAAAERMNTPITAHNSEQPPTPKNLGLCPTFEELFCGAQIWRRAQKIGLGRKPAQEILGFRQHKRQLRILA